MNEPSKPRFTEIKIWVRIKLSVLNEVFETVTNGREVYWMAHKISNIKGIRFKYVFFKVTINFSVFGLSLLFRIRFMNHMNRGHVG